jgi:outer membrane protein assembly factor BamB
MILRCMPRSFRHVGSTRKRVRVLVACASAAAVAAASGGIGRSSTVASGTGDWPQFGYDAGHSGWNPRERQLGISNVRRLKVAWRIPDRAAVWSAPAFAAGAVFFASRDGTVRAVRSDTGRTLWRVRPARQFVSSPAVAPGRLYVVTEGRLRVRTQPSNGAD